MHLLQTKISKRTERRATFIRNTNQRISIHSIPKFPIPDHLSEKSETKHLSSSYSNSTVKDQSLTIHYVIPHGYSVVWQKVRFKLRILNVFVKIIENQRLYGTNFPLTVTPLLGDSSHDKMLKSRVTRILEPVQELMTREKIPCLILNPKGKTKKFWNVIVVILLIYTAFFTPFVLAFVEYSVNDPMFWVEYVVTFLFFVDFLVNFTSAYYDKNGVLVSNRIQIALKYAKGWMTIDFLSWFPIDVLLDTSASNHTIARFFRIPKLYRLLRISRLFKLLKTNFQIQVIEHIQEFFSLTSSVMRLLQSLLSIMISIHIFACFWYLTAKIYNFSPNTWVFRYDLLDADTSSLYITSVYWAVTSISTVGYGDITPFTALEISLALLWMAFGLYFFSFTIGSLNSMLSSMDLKENVLESKLAAIDEFSSEANLSKNLTRKIKKSLKYASEKRGFSWHDKLNIFNELPKGLRFEVAINMHHGAAKTLNFFSNKDQSLIAMIVPLLEPIYADKECWIYEEGDFADEIYFLVKGNIRLIVEKTVAIMSVQKGCYFGDVEIFRVISRRYAAFSTRYSELLTMNKNVINQIKNEYYKVWEDMYYTALDREKKYERIFIEIKEIDKLYDGTQINRKILKEYNIKVQIMLNERMKKLRKDETYVSSSEIGKKIDDIIKYVVSKKTPEQKETIFKYFELFNSKIIKI